MSNSAFAASERRHLEEEPDTCPQHGTPTDSWGYCGACDDEAYEWAINEADEREERAAARGRECD